MDMIIYKSILLNFLYFRHLFLGNLIELVAFFNTVRQSAGEFKDRSIN